MIYNRDNYILNDSSLKKELLELFKKADRLIIFDIGACEGEESIRYSKIFSYSSIYSFEPLPKNQRLILENIEKYKIGNIELIPLAVSDGDGKSEFYVSSGHPENLLNDMNWDFGNKSSSLLVPENKNNPSWLSFNDKIDVKTITLFTFLDMYKINEVDFIHMDVQGAELKVLKGAKDHIKKIKSIWLEVADIELYKSQPLRVDIENFMRSNGFCLIKSELEGKVGDQLYINKRYFKSYFLLNKYLQFYIKKIVQLVNNRLITIIKKFLAILN